MTRYDMELRNADGEVGTVVTITPLDDPELAERARKLLAEEFATTRERFEEER